MHGMVLWHTREGRWVRKSRLQEYILIICGRICHRIYILMKWNLVCSYPFIHLSFLDSESCGCDALAIDAFVVGHLTIFQLYCVSVWLDDHQRTFPWKVKRDFPSLSTYTTPSTWHIAKVGGSDRAY